MATKEELHARLAKMGRNATITVEEFISVYGDDRSERRGYEDVCRADVYAKRYGCMVVKEPDQYTFYKIPMGLCGGSRG
jgi:hypothetical protein